MNQPLICHFLIGLPASAKSTFARKLQEMIPNAVIVSTDTVRQKLYGEESNPGNWANEVEPEVLKQIQNAIASNKPVIYDATNARRDWRMGMLMKIEEKLKEIDAPQVHWIAWHLQTPVDVCKEWNQNRQRRVPDHVIEEYAEYLNQFRPHKGEGFIQIFKVFATQDDSYTIKIGEKSIDIQQAIALKHDFSKKQNRNKQYTWHQYSRLLDFDRLMHLISTLIRYPGIGNSSQTEPETLKKALKIEKLPRFDTAVEEITAVINQEYSSLYSEKKAITKDLLWLEKNGLIGNIDIESELDIDKIEPSAITEAHQLFTHRYSNLEAFSRLIKIIRLITYYPFLCIDGKTATKETITIGGYSETVRHTAVVEKLIEKEILPIDVDDINSRKRLENLVREDLRQLKPYRIIHDPFNTTPYSEVTKKFAMNKGYFIGTGIFSKQELNEVFNLLRSQSEREYFNDPLAGIYQTFQERMEHSKLWQDPPPYPIKVIGSKSVVDFNQDKVNRSRFEAFDNAIRKSQLIELEILRQPWESQKKLRHIKVYPLQIVFHLFAWYLGYEIAEEGENQGLLYFERVDRLRVSKTFAPRDQERQIKALKELNKLYQSSAGIYLGNSVSDQRKYLNPKKRKSVEKTLKIYATKHSFDFLSETSQRFSINQMKMTLPEWLEGKAYNKEIYCLKTEQKYYPHAYRIEIILPKWFVDDIYLIKWLVPWGKEVKVIEPPELIEQIMQRGNEIQELYSNNSNCDR